MTYLLSLFWRAPRPIAIGSLLVISALAVLPHVIILAEALQ